MARAAKRGVYKTPSAPKKNTGRQKSFEVMPGRTLFDSNGKRCDAGEQAMLTESFANYFANRNFIVVTLKFEEEDSDTTKEAGDAPIAVVKDKNTASSGTASDSGRGKHADEPPKNDTNETSRTGSVRRKADTL